MSYKDLKFPERSVFLVTGGAGFIGSNLVEAILDLGYKVKCLDNLSTGFQSNIDLFFKNKNFEFIFGDIRDFETCMKATEGVDFVLHQAAWGSVPRSIEMPLLYEEINIKGTLNMLEASRLNNIKKFVYASSSSVYGDDPNLPKIEGREGNLLSPYAVTKIVNEHYGKLYKSLYGLDTYGLRYFNVFGRRQNPDGTYAAVIPKFIKSKLMNENVYIYGNGEQSRDFTYIDNVIFANFKACLANSQDSGLVYNVGNNERITLNLLNDLIDEILQNNSKLLYTSERRGDVIHSFADVTLAFNKIDYFPFVPFIKGIRNTVDWFKVNQFTNKEGIQDE